MLPHLYAPSGIARSHVVLLVCASNLLNVQFLVAMTRQANLVGSNRSQFYWSDDVVQVKSIPRACSLGPWQDSHACPSHFFVMGIPNDAVRALTEVLREVVMTAFAGIRTLHTVAAALPVAAAWSAGLVVAACSGRRLNSVLTPPRIG